MDPWRGHDDDPISLHKYLYANANPVTFKDPTGFFSLVESTVANNIASELALQQVQFGMSFWDHVLDPERDPDSFKNEAAFGLVIVAAFSSVKILGKFSSKWRKFLKKAGPKCFAKGTLVSTSQGPRPIEEIQVGELVLSKHEETGELGYQAVTRVFETPENDVGAIRLADENHEITSLSVTRAHPFWVEEEGWIDSDHLEKGMRLWSKNRGFLTVVAGWETDRKATTYNFEIENFHTYLVGKAGVWVHNTGDCHEIARVAIAKLHNGCKELFQCTQFAKALKTRLIKDKVNGTLIKLKSPTNFISFLKLKTVITENGYHEAIKLGDTVYDNINPSGIPYSQWVDDLGLNIVARNSKRIEIIEEAF